MLKSKKNKLVLGITGNIACGKSTVAAMFKTKDSQLIDADLLGHELLSVGCGVYKKIIKSFGRGILKANKEIDRAKLASIVFARNESLVRLNSIVHPVLIREIKRLIRNSNKKVIILDAALIIEAGLSKTVDKIVVVTAKRNQQILRAAKVSGLNKGQIMARLKFQISQGKKLPFADFTIDNSGSIGKTRKQVLEIRRKLWKS
ncbi:MAG: dephospho-CoA kinase [Candidatus Omnitrophica bacterium]|nr:dephospho-CoA kinase [Candidatus Omnitrophota bacterium]